MTDTLTDEDRAALVTRLRSALSRVTHKNSCAPSASNFDKHKLCECGRDDALAAIREAMTALAGKRAAQVPREPTPKPVLYLRMCDGTPDWGEECVNESPDDLLLGLEDEDGYSVVPLYAAPPAPPDQARGDTAMLDWLDRSSINVMARSGKQSWRGLIAAAIAAQQQNQGERET